MAGDSSPIASPVEAIQFVLNSILQIGGGNVRGLFMDYGENLLLGLTIIAVLWTTIKNTLEASPIQKLLAEYMTVVFTWGIAAWMIGTANAGGVSLGREINAGFDMLANSVLGATKSASGSSAGLEGKVPKYSITGDRDEYEKESSKFQGGVATLALAKSMQTAAKLFETPEQASETAINEAKSNYASGSSETK